MQISVRAFVSAIHGLLFGGFFLLTAFGILLELTRSAYATQPAELTRPGRSLATFYLCVTAILGWAAVFAGTYIVYPWYRAIPRVGAALPGFPQSLLLASSTTSAWHRLGMEWKEHLAWFAPMLITVVAYVLIRQRSAVAKHPQVRRALLTYALIAFLSAGVAAFFGAMINKRAPVKGGSEIHFLKEP